MGDRFVSESDYFWADIDTSVTEPHECESVYEITDPPNRAGIIRVHEMCHCGRETKAYNDSLL